METLTPARKLKRWMVFAIVAGISAFAGPAVAEAAPPAHASSSCYIGGSGTSYNQLGTPAYFSRLRTAQGMNCASARYVLNKWLRRSYRNSYADRLPTHFYDGYVTWHCGRTYGRGWRCSEYDSYTAFRFSAYTL